VYRRCPSIQKIDFDRLDNLARVVEHLRQTMEQEITGMSKDVDRLLQNTEANYSEYYVCTATQEAASLLREIEMLARRLDDQMREKVSGLKYAVSQYAQTDKQVEKLAQTQPSSSLFEHKSPLLAAQWSDITGNRLYGPMRSSSPESPKFPNIFEQLQAIQRQGIIDRLAPFQEDPRIAALLQTMQNQDAFAQRLAQAELTKIAEAFTETPVVRRLMSSIRLMGNVNIWSRLINMPKPNGRNSKKWACRTSGTKKVLI